MDIFLILFILSLFGIGIFARKIFELSKRVTQFETVEEQQVNLEDEEYPFNQNEISLSSVTDILMLRDARENTPSLDMESEGEDEEQVQQDDYIGILGELYPTELVLTL